MELTVSIAHQQHSVVDEPRAAEGPEWVSNPMAIELRRKQGAGGRLKGEVRKAQTRGGEGQRGQDLTCMPKALMATEIGPFWASQAAISGRGRQCQWYFGPAVSTWTPPQWPPLTVLIPAQLH